MPSERGDETPRSRAVSVSCSATPAHETDTEEHENPAPKPLHVNISTLPSPREICDRIPSGGIKIVDLVMKFKDRIDATNVRLFIEYIKAIAPVEEKHWVKRPSQLPSRDQINDIIKNARKPALDPYSRFLSLSKSKEKYKPQIHRDITRNLLSPAIVTFSEREELIRNSSNILPKSFYRTTHEDSATLSRFINPESLKQYRGRPDLKLREDNAFQAIGEFKPLIHVSEDGFRRHLSWPQKAYPSPFISAFDSMARAEARASWHHHTSKRVGKRCCVVEVPSTGLVAAAIHMSLEETDTIFTISRKRKSTIRRGRNVIETTTTERNLKILVWVHESMKPPDGSTLPIERLEESDCEMWISITEMRRADPSFRLACSKGHDYEWLACGSIKCTRVSRVTPYDGQELHMTRGITPVSSIGSAEPWLWDWNIQMWYLENRRPLKRTSDLEEDSGIAQKRHRVGDGSTPTFHPYTLDSSA